MKKKLLLVICLALLLVTVLSATALADTAITSLTSVSGLTMPQAGQTLDFTVNANHSWCYVDSVEWDDTTADKWDVSSSYKAIAGNRYRYDITIIPYSGYYFPHESGSGWQLYTGDARLDGVKCKTSINPGPCAMVLADSGYTNSGYLVITGYYTVPEAAGDTEITYVNVYAADSVTVGERLGNYYKSSGSNYSFKRIMWRSKTHDVLDSYINTETRAEAGESYRYRLYLKPDSGYVFPGEYEGYSYKSFQGTVKLNGKTVQGFVDTDGALFVESDWMTAGSAADIDNVALTVTAPKAGSKPATSFKAVNKSTDVALSQNNIIWYEYDETKETWKYISTEVFVEGVQYRVMMVVKPESGYFAGHPSSSSDTYTGKYTVNGNTPSAKDKKDSVAYGDSGTTYARCLVAYYTFAAGPVITKQPAAQSALPGGSAVFSVEATGENLKYQWYGGTDASPTPVGGNDKTLTLTNLTLNNNDTYFWCVVSNEAGSATSNKAKLTVADNYVFPFTDVYANDWFYNDVKNANKLKLIDGKTPTLFKPYDNMTYAEAIKLAACMNQVYNTGTVTLKNGSPWYQTYVDYARTHGIPWNYPDYNAAITRKDYVYIFYSALPASDYKAINSIGMAQIPDVGPSTFASTEILAFYNAGILTGYTDGSFAPDKNIERSEVATILSRMMDHNVRKSFSL